MVQTLLTSAPATGLLGVPSSRERFVSPMTAAHGTGLSFAGTSAAANAFAQVAVAGARVIDLPGSPPRGAPV